MSKSKSSTDSEDNNHLLTLGLALIWVAALIWLSTWLGL